MARKAKQKQLELRLPTWGGKRRGAGRKPGGPRSMVGHDKRPVLTGREPLHVTWRLTERVWNLRNRSEFRRLLRAFASSNRDAFHLTHYSVQSNHLHLIVEAADTRSLSRGMQGLGVRLARTINTMIGTSGKVFSDRFHVHVLRTPTEVREAIAYVLNNFAKHCRELGKPVPPGPDPFAAGPELDSAESRWVQRMGAIVQPRTWLLAVGAAQAAPARRAA